MIVDIEVSRLSITAALLRMGRFQEICARRGRGPYESQLEHSRGLRKCQARRESNSTSVRRRISNAEEQVDPYTGYQRTCHLLAKLKPVLCTPIITYHEVPRRRENLVPLPRGLSVLTSVATLC
jgi:hypothetical protein